MSPSAQTERRCASGRCSRESVRGRDWQGYRDLSTHILDSVRAKPRKKRKKIQIERACEGERGIWPSPAQASKYTGAHVAHTHTHTYTHIHTHERERESVCERKAISRYRLQARDQQSAGQGARGRKRPVRVQLFLASLLAQFILQQLEDWIFGML